MEALEIAPNGRSKTLNYGYIFRTLNEPDGEGAIHSTYLQDKPDAKEIYQLLLQLRSVNWDTVKTFDEHEILRRLPYPVNMKHTLIDVGAHIGSSAMPFAQKGWRVVAFEPEPTNYQQLCNNLRNFNKVTCIPKAVSEISGQQVPFYVSPEHWGIHSFKPFHPTHRPTLTVDTVRLDEAIAEIEIDHVTVLKIDIEGADFIALKSFDFEQYLPEVVMCEYMDERSQKNFGYSHHDMVAYMADFGYTAFISEWAPVLEYARKGVPTAPHRFLKCVPYPLDHDPAWGNVFFVPQDKVTHFLGTLLTYLREVEGIEYIPPCESTRSKVQPSRTENAVEHPKRQSVKYTHESTRENLPWKEAASLDDMAQLLVELSREGDEGLPVLWEDYERNYLPDNYLFLSHHQFLNETITRLKENSKPASWLHWIASGILKFYLAPRGLDLQRPWLRKFQFILFDIEEKLQTLDINQLDLSEQYFLSSVRHCISSLYLRVDFLLLQDRQFFEDIHSSLVRMCLWKLGCLDQYDIDLLKRIAQMTHSLEPGTALTEVQYFPCLALMLYRKPSRLALNLESDTVFSSYADELIRREPNLKGNPYCNRVLTLRNQPEERSLWYLENYEGISSYWNRHKGESCFIIGNGPSLRRMDLSPLRQRVTFGLNKIYMLFDQLGFETTYLVAANPYVIQQAARDLLSLSMPQFISMWGRGFIEKRDNILFLRENSQPLFVQDITQGVCIDCTVTYMAMQIAYYMGFETVILIGVDHFFESKGDPHKTIKLKGGDPDHFDPNYFGYGLPWHLPDLEGSERAYHTAKTVFEVDGRQIIDATVGGKLTIFPKITYEDAIKIT